MSINTQNALVYSDAPHMSTVCARCRFGPATPAAAAWLMPPTYAFVLALGTDVQVEAAAAETWAAANAELSATAFCCACARVCWLARHEDAQTALLAHAALLHSVRALRRQAGIGPPGMRHELPAVVVEAGGPWGADAPPTLPKPKRKRVHQPTPPPAAADDPLFDFDWAA